MKQKIGGKQTKIKTWEKRKWLQRTLFQEIICLKVEKNTVYQIYINLEVILYKLVTTIREQFINIAYILTR